MAKYNEDESTRVTSVTPDPNGSVSERSERELEGAAPELEDDDDDEESQEQRAADDKGEATPDKIIAGLRKRNAKLTAQRNRARTEAHERESLKERLAKYEEREREAERMLEDARRRTPEGQKVEERRSAVRQTIDEAYGPGTSDYLDTMFEDKQREREQHAQVGISYLKSELEDHDLPVDDEALVRWERAVGSEMAEDQQLLAAFRRPATQKAAITEAFNRVRDGLVNPVLKHSGAKSLARIERNREAVLGGGKNRGTVAETPEPTFDLTPPKGLTGRALEEWWNEARDQYKERLLAADRVG